jgi:prolyl-tRNA editing enzyme YbaK/EbsC (Cys-tRNA(Pro) deacylase)
VDPRVNPIEQLVVDAAASTGAAFDVIECDPDLADTAAFCEAYGIDPADSANTILIATKEDVPRHVACVVLATHRLDVNGMVRRRLGARKVSFAPADATGDLTGMFMGGVTPFGLPANLPVWVDAAVMARPSVVVGGGSRAMKLRCPPGTLAALNGVEIVDDLARAIEG